MTDTRVESIIPVTVLQLLRSQRSQDETFQIDGNDVQQVILTPYLHILDSYSIQVTIVGRLVRVMLLETSIQYTVSDGTGLIDLTKWISTTSMMEDREREKMVRSLSPCNN